MTCCTGDCNQGRDCPTTRTYPRTLAEAFPRHPAPDFVEEGQDYHKALEWVLLAFIVVSPVIVWLL